MVSYDEKRIIEILDAFYNLAGIHVGIYLYHPNGHKLLSHPDVMCSFCSLIRSKPEINEKCEECNLVHMEECKKKGEPIKYTCHMGLTEVIVPLKENHVAVCCFMFGQLVIDDSKEQSREIIYNNIKNAGFDDAEIKKVINEIQCLSDSKINSMITILQAVISNVQMTELIDYSNIKFLDNLNSFIDSSISKNILISDICEHLNLSRNYLYMYTKKYINCTLNEYIIDRRIHHAKNYLEHSNISIMEISQKTGFSDYHYFARIFKKKTNISPREYRKNRYKTV